MKEIVVVEDRPWVTTKSTVELQKKGVRFRKIIFYPNKFLNSTERDKKFKEYIEKTQIDSQIVNSQRELLDALDVLYEEENNVFFMDYDLKGDMRVEDFFSRINIKYALEKRKNGEKKIWFYTGGGEEVKRALVDNFRDRVIKTPLIIRDQIYWDIDQILEIVGG